MTDRRAPMSVGFWIGNGPRKIIVPLTLTMATLMVTAAASSFQSVRRQAKLAATVEANAAQRSAQIDSLQAQSARMQHDINELKRTSITREDINDLKNDLKADIRELRGLVIRGRE
jgi:TolA-binding protein